MFAFADSIHPDQISPFEFDHVAAYANGAYQWTPAQLARYPRHFKIAVLGGQPEQARIARCLDMERYDAQAADFPPFTQERIAAGHDDALGYCSIIGENPPGRNLFGVKGIIDAMLAAGLGGAAWRLWVAWWWGRPFPPTAAEVLAEIHALTGVTLPTGRLAGCQWYSAPPDSAVAQLDRSVWYIADNFAREQQPAPALAGAA